MKILRNTLKSELNIRTERDFPKKGMEFIDVNPLVIQKETLNEIVTSFVKALKRKKIDYIVCPEARGFLFGMAIANELGCGCVPVRKKGKMPPTTVEATFDFEKEYGKDTLVLPKLVNTTYKNKRFYIIDDVYATGNTIKAIKEELIKLGGKVVGEGAVLNIKELNDSKDVFSLIDVNEE